MMASFDAMLKRVKRLEQIQLHTSNPRLDAQWAALCEGARDELLPRLMIAVGENLQEDQGEPVDEEERAEFAAMLAKGAERTKQQFMRYRG